MMTPEDCLCLIINQLLQHGENSLFSSGFSFSVTSRKLYELMNFAKSISLQFFNRYKSGLLRAKLSTVLTISSHTVFLTWVCFDARTRSDHKFKLMFAKHTDEKVALSEAHVAVYAHWPAHFFIVVLGEDLRRKRKNGGALCCPWAKGHKDEDGRGKSKAT